MAIGLTHGGSNVYSCHQRPDQLVIGTQDGLVFLEREKRRDWRLTQRSLPGLHISSFIMEPGSGVMFAGAFFGSVHASHDGGKTWERRDQGVTQHDVYSLASAQTDGKVRVYAGTQPAHLFYTEDLGLHWTELPSMRAVPSAANWSFPAPPHVAHTKFITFDPHDATIVYACIEQGALLKSSNGGQTWGELNTVGFLRDRNRPPEHFYDVHRMLIDPGDPNKLYVTGGAGLYVTLDGGGRWERWTSSDWAADVYPDGFVFNPRQPDTMFISAAEHNPSTWHHRPHAGGRIYRSDDGGRNWTRLAGGLPETMKHEIGALCLADWGEGYSVFAGTTGGEVYGSEDGGESWNLLVSGLAPISKKGHERLLAAS